MHVLPFAFLDPATFERLCLWLVRAEGFVAAEHYGAAGADSGRDIVAYRDAAERRELWYFQCKRRSRVSSRMLIEDAERAFDLTASQLGGAPAGMVFMLAGQVSARVRDDVRAAVLRRGVECQFWASTELDARVKAYPPLLSEFFQLPAANGAHVSVPRRLPRAPLRFVNRERELAGLDQLLVAAEQAPGPVVAVLCGMHGVGKSAAGSFWSNRHRMRFSGGDLYGDFSRRPGGLVDPSEVLADFLRDLGTADVGIPAGFAERRRLFERMTAERPLLMLLDDVDEPAQVLSLLPTGAGSVVVVTSNRRLEEVLYEGASSVALDPFDGQTARRLLSELVGADRLAAETEAVAELIRLCAGLPILLCVAAGRLVANRGRSVSWLVRQVNAAPQRLQALSGTGSFAAEGVFDFAYRDLEPSTALVYRRLGVHPGADLVASVAAMTAGVALSQAQAALDALYGTHLIDMPTEDRYRLHDLVREHAKACLDRDDEPIAVEAATRRLVDWYLASLRLADRAVVADRLRLSDELTLDAGDLPVFDGPAAAFGWFAGERANVMAVLQVAVDRGWDERVWQLAETLWPLCASHKLFSEWIASQQAGAQAGARLGDECVQARFQSQLARAYAEVGDAARAGKLMSQAHDAAAVCGHPLLAASVTEFGGVCLLHAGRPGEAFDEFVRAREMFVAADYGRGMALQDLYGGSALVHLEEFDRSLVWLGRALNSLTMFADEISVGRVLLQRGTALLGMGRAEDARADLEQAIDVMGEYDIGFEQAQALEVLARVEEAGRHVDRARAHRLRAVELYRRLGHPRAEELGAAFGV